ncbi:MAG: acyl-CoA desaturase [Leptospiraceae bacterium]|nr:acyl-CoA desaturase [Leptospiraceae bacterium]MCP5503282.1 acyl-CoA desaturase [Leptospiraceae bacterium]
MEEKVEFKPKRTKISLLSFAVFSLVHATILIAFFVPFSWELVLIAVLSYYLRMFGITAGFHRYFAHNAFKTSRPMQFFFAWLGGTAMQKGALWWGAHHRDHHRYSDTDKDLHSPKHGFWHSHMLWFLGSEHNTYDVKKIKDYAKYPELVFIDKHYWIPPLSYAFMLYGLGYAFGGQNHLYAFSVLTWGYAVSTFFLGHGTWTINSLSHVFGKQRYTTGDTSRNNFLLALVTMGEGWHNNHHYYRHTANQGFYWYEVDMSYYILKMMSWIGLVWDLKTPPVRILEEGKRLDAIQKGQEKFKNLSGEWIPVHSVTANSER